ncbi:hypothetical protein NLG97_g8681 [Lecanicillium saksenae]|uniref:Uncharacterized protein n=1 Tax=Lecanicillium saksenae TaxID=468837 RepID=A0ACC1QJF3_9HYPO|nr:hypothetical protein NLG97_g8681 [Lecanicillium saksenae]
MASSSPLSPSHIAELLSQDACSIFLNSSGVTRVDSAQLPSNTPCEDRFNRAQPLPLWDGDTWTAATVFDGHGGWQTADHLEKNLLAAVQGSLNKLSPESRGDDSIRQAIAEAFAELDDSIINNYARFCGKDNREIRLAEKVRCMEVAMSGSCALLLLYNTTTRTLYTACTGDSRAVVSQQMPDGSWPADALSEDQKGTNESEIARIRREHPNENEITKDGKVLGMAVTRAFGDFAYKERYETQLELGQRFATSRPYENHVIPTPPYLTAKPVVTVRKLRDESPAIIIMASDGLWDMCENYEAVDLVVRWLEAQPQQVLQELRTEWTMTPETVWWKKNPQPEAENTRGWDFLTRWHQFDVRFLPHRTVVKDLDNAAVHLMRNALGGNHEELLTGRLAYGSPYARYVRDDITVQVLFLF